MGKLKNLKKLEKLKPYVLQLNLQPKRLYYTHKKILTSFRERLGFLFLKQQQDYCRG